VHAAHCAQCRAEMFGEAVPENSTAATIPATSGARKSVAMNVEQIEIIDDKSSNDISESEFIVVDKAVQDNVWKAEISIVGMTCSACVGSISSAVEALSFVQSINVALLTNSATVVFNGRENADEIIRTVEDAGFDATLENLEQKTPTVVRKKAGKDLWKLEVAIGGMTCSACINSVKGALDKLPYVENANINLISNSGYVVFEGEHHAGAIKEAIEDAGFDATIDSLERLTDIKATDMEEREIFIRVGDMYCHHCPDLVLNDLRKVYGDAVEITKELTLDDPVLKVKYVARPPDFTIRHIILTIGSVDEKFAVSIFHPPTIEDRSRAMQQQERKRILFRLALSITAAIPAFIIGIVCMSILVTENSVRMYMMHPIWAGTVSRAEWALFFLSTPIYFFAADTFHRKAFKELKALWRPSSKVSIIHRFTRFGSMNMLMSLGTTIAYFSSVAELVHEATQNNAHFTHRPGHDPGDHSSMPDHGSMKSMDPMQNNMHAIADKQNQMKHESHNYFDTVVFLTMFLLLGRFIEAYSKAKTGDAVTALGKLRPAEAILVEHTGVTGKKLATDLLDVGDVVLVTNGASPPYDGIIIDGSAKFDESSLTGESRLVSKDVGDPVFSGTVNQGGPVSVKLTSSGTSMLDQIIKVVREGQTKRAPVERVADIITGHFVPFVVLVGIITWIVWLSLGQSGTLPGEWIEGSMGGWPLWSLRFAIAVFVVACPCGIGLAAPTALFVGGGLAAKNGILVKGGGEAFQEASSLDCIVFDKTGTLTSGGDPSVVDYQRLTDIHDSEFLGMVQRMEDNSGHPVAKAMAKYCSGHANEGFVSVGIEEKPGRGMLGKFRYEEEKHEMVIELLVGNETLMNEHNVLIGERASNTLQGWKQAGNSVVLVALRTTDSVAEVQNGGWILTAIFAIADALRPESKFIVKSLQDRNIAVWMLSGDNVETAQAIGAMVGIAKENIIAGVLPEQKAEKIQWLQKTLTPPKRKKRALVAMVGDGINDSPALTMADVGIAIGSGSDVAISSAEFILISSDLSTIITLIDLSRTVFRRVWFNFGWAIVYNAIAMPVAAGVFYPIVSKGKHVTLDPVWASLAMALSSISVICSSLMLRTRLPLVGFRPTLNTRKVDVKES